MTKEKKLLKDLIICDIKKAYKSKESSDISNAITSISRINNKGELDIELMQELKNTDLDIKFIWRFLENNDTHKEKRLFLLYKDTAFIVE